MRIRNNVIANYCSQALVSLMAIVMLPTYLRLIGAEGYGLVGFFAMLQIWFGLLDLGLSATMGREAARFAGGAQDGRRLRELLRAMEWIFIMIALLGAATLILLSSYLAEHWLRSNVLGDDEVSGAIQIMALIVALRWLGGLYRGIISGFERQVWLAAYNIAFNAARYIGVIPALLWFGPSVSVFFLFQVVIATVELAVLLAKAYALVPGLDSPLGFKIRLKPLLPMLRFSLSISFVGVVWVLVTQLDKLLLSKLLTLADFGLFAMAASAASGIMMFSAPISTAVQPRLARLHDEGNETDLLLLYRKATRMISVMVFPVAAMLWAFSEPVLRIWTADAAISRAIALVFSLYVLGNAVLAVAAFPYYLQFAKGQMRLHLFGNMAFLLILVPAIIVSTIAYGMTGAGWAWLLANLAYLLFWVPLVHRKFAPGLHRDWLIHDIGMPALVSVAIAFLTYLLVPEIHNRAGMLLVIMFGGIVTLGFTALSVPQSRAWMLLAAKGVLGKAGHVIASR